MKFQTIPSTFFFLLLLLNHTIKADESLITSTCTQTPHKALCISSLKSDNRSFKTDTSGLALILVQQISNKTEQAIKVVNQHIKTTKDPKQLQALKQCKELYNAVIVADVAMAIEGLRKGDPKFAEQGAVDAVNEVKSCEGGFGRGVVTSPVSGLNKEIGLLGEVVASISKQLE